MKLTTKAAIILTVIFTFQIVLGSGLFLVHQESAANARSIKQSLARTATGSSVLASVIKLRQVLAEGNLNSPQIDETAKQTLKSTEALADLYPSNWNGQATLNQIVASVQRCVNFVHDTRKASLGKKKNNQAIYDDLTRFAKKNIAITSDLSQKIADEQVAIESALAAQQAHRKMVSNLLFAGIALELLLILSSILWFERHLGKRLATVLTNVDMLARRKPLLTTVSGLDEIAYLDLTLHQLSNSIAEATNKERQLLDSQRDVICVVDRALTIVKINQACQSLLQYLPEELHGKPITQLLPAAAKQDLDQHLQSAHNANSARFETQLQAKDGSYRDARWVVRWVEKEQFYFCILHDIAAQKRAERLQQEVLQMVIHDLRSPLMTLNGILQLFETGALGSLSTEGTARVDDSLNSCEDLLSLVNNMLDLERIRAGMFELKTESLSLQPLLERSAEHVSSLAQRLGVAVEIHTGQFQLLADQIRMEKLIEAMLANSIKRSVGGAKSTAESSALSTARNARQVTLFTEGTGPFVEIRISDSGPSIAQNEKTNAPSAQDMLNGSQPTTQTIDQAIPLISALNWAWCQALVELHRGQLLAQNRAPAGCTFTVQIPRLS